MTENKCIEILTLSPSTKEKVPNLNEVYEVAIKAMKEIQQYRAIGTVEECKVAVEKQKAKAPDIWGDGTDDKGQIIYEMYDCPNCGESYEIEYDDYNYCPECGQKLERTRLNE